MKIVHEIDGEAAVGASIHVGSDRKTVRVELNAYVGDDGEGMLPDDLYIEGDARCVLKMLRDAERAIKMLIQMQIKEKKLDWDWAGVKETEDRE